MEFVYIEPSFTTSGSWGQNLRVCLCWYWYTLIQAYWNESHWKLPRGV